MSAWNARRKYGNTKIELDGEVFDSKKEANRWKELQLLQKAGEISYLRRQVVFELIPVQRIDGKVVERECRYKADFVYMENGKPDMVVEDTKGYRTPDYIIKRKLMLRVWGIRIKEI